MGNLLALAPGLGIGFRGRASGWAASLLTILLFLSGNFCASAQSIAPAVLLSVEDTVVPAGIVTPSAALRSRHALISSDLLLQASQVTSGSRFQLNLFPDFSPVGIIHRWERSADGRLVGLGVVEGMPLSQVILALEGATLTATVTTSANGRYRLQPTGHGSVLVSEINVASLSHCAVGKVPLENILADPRKKWLADAQKGKVSALAVNTNQVSIVDLLVVYTSQARAGAGGEAALRTLADLAVAEANSIYQNSRANVRLRLVAQVEVAYTEHPNLSTNLNRLRINGDGFMDEIHALRETNRADVVCLITETAEEGFSGLAFTMSPVTVGFSPFAFAVVKREDAVGTYTFAHEISHVLGCQHDRDNALDNEGQLLPGAFPYSFGHRFMTEETLYRTVMAYEPGFRIPFFSNPLILYGGVPMGIPETDTNNAADNVKSLNGAASTVSAFFGPAVSTRPPVATLLSPTGGTIVEAGVTVALSVQASDPDGTIASVEFFSGDTYIGAVPDLIPGISLDAYVFTWVDVESGNYSISARVTDNLGASTYTAPINFIARPLNDDFSDQHEIAGSLVQQTNSNKGASFENNEPLHSGNIGGASVWFNWVAPSSGTLTLEIVGDKFQPLASVYTGNALPQLTARAQSITFDTQNRIVRVLFDAAAGTEYKFAVDGSGGTSGHFTLRLSYNLPPENNDFANRISVSGESLDFTTQNRFASIEAGEPLPTGNPGGKSIWYSWVAPRNGSISILMDSQTFFPLTDAYTGNAVNAITVVPGRKITFDETNFVTEVTFDVVTGQTYAIVVDGLGGGSGDVQFKLFYQPPPANDLFVNRQLILGTNVQFNTANFFATTEAGEPQHVPPNNSGRSIWYSWVAPVSGPVTFTAQGSNLFLLPDVYQGTNVSSLQRVAGRIFAIDQPTFTSTINFTAVAFQSYEIALAGFNGTSGNIAFHLTTQNVPPVVQNSTLGQDNQGNFSFQIGGSNGQQYLVQVSTNLTTWTDLFTGTFSEGSATFTDNQAPGNTRRFYRVLPVP